LAPCPIRLAPSSLYSWSSIPFQFPRRRFCAFHPSPPEVKSNVLLFDVYSRLGHPPLSLYFSAHPPNLPHFDVSLISYSLSYSTSWPHQSSSYSRSIDVLYVTPASRTAGSDNLFYRFFPPPRCPFRSPFDLPTSGSPFWMAFPPSHGLLVFPIPSFLIAPRCEEKI